MAVLACPLLVTVNRDVSFVPNYLVFGPNILYPVLTRETGPLMCIPKVAPQAAAEIFLVRPTTNLTD